jgi:hypothetical protein
MRTPAFGFMLVLACLVLWPVDALAQSEIAGVVKDASGSVLPGVTVEASSPALIEKIRAAVTDGEGNYRIVYGALGPLVSVVAARPIVVRVRERRLG